MNEICFIRFEKSYIFFEISLGCTVAIFQSGLNISVLMYSSFLSSATTSVTGSGGDGFRFVSVNIDS